MTTWFNSRSDAPTITTDSSISSNPSPSKESASSRSKSMSSAVYYDPGSKVKVAGVKKPLSPAAAAAFYARQVRNGGNTHDQPSAPVIGVKRDASDTAAILAINADLGPKLWKHTQSQTAGTAATLAQNTNSSPEIWKPDPSATANSAALSARGRNYTVKSIADYDEAAVHAQGKQAAVHIAAVSGRDYAAQALPDAYEFADKRERSYTLDGGFSASETIGGIHNKLVEQQEQRRRASTLSDAGLKPLGVDYLATLESKARENAKERLSKVYVGSHNPGKISWDSAGAAAAYHASDAATLDNPMLLLTPQYLDIAQKDRLIAAARLRAATSLTAIDDDLRYKKPFTNIPFSEAALKIAADNSKKRLENHGKIDMGGGMFMTQSEVEAIAQRNVHPVLEKISEQALKQREEDEERRAAEEAERERKRIADEEERQKRLEEKRTANEQKLEDKRIRNEEKAALKAERDKQKAIEKAERDKAKSEQKAERVKIVAARRVQRQSEKQIQNEARAKTRHEKSLLAEQKKQEKLTLKAALAEAKQAEALAAAEAARLLALKKTREAELESARIAEEQAKSEAEAEAARLELEAKQSALAAATAEYDTAADNEKVQHAAVASTAASILEVEREEQSLAEEVEEPEDKGIDTILEEDGSPGVRESTDTGISGRSAVVEGESSTSVPDDQPWEVIEKSDVPEEALNGDAKQGVEEKEASTPVVAATSVPVALPVSVAAPVSPVSHSTSTSPTSPRRSSVGGWFKKQAQKVKDQRNKVILTQTQGSKRATTEQKGKVKAEDKAVQPAEAVEEGNAASVTASLGESFKSAEADLVEEDKVEEEEEKPLEPGIVEAVLHKTDTSEEEADKPEAGAGGLKPLVLVPTSEASNDVAEEVSEDKPEAETGDELAIPSAEDVKQLHDEVAQEIQTEAEGEKEEGKGIFKEAIV